MKTAKYYLVFSFLLLCLSLTGCHRSGDDVWEDTKSASRHVNRGFRTLGGKHGDSRAVRSRQEFEYCNNNFDPSCQPFVNVPPPNPMHQDFIPLVDEQNCYDVAMADSYVPQPRETPGDPGSSVPGINYFRDPNTIPGMAMTFRNIYFEYNSNAIKGQENFQTMRNVADYLRTHPNVYVFVEGHTDERGPEAYNLALGSRRSNAVRNELIAAGVSPDNIFTISYGKERPLVFDHHEEAWSQNRRAEFKIYQR